MLMTSALLFIAMREVWGWGLLGKRRGRRRVLFVDAASFSANLVKVADGGYVPLLLASLVYGVMLIWHRGSTAVAQVLNERLIPVGEFMAVDRIPQDSACSGHRGLPHQDSSGHAAGHGLARQAQSGLARSSVRSQGR